MRQDTLSSHQCHRREGLPRTWSFHAFRREPKGGVKLQRSVSHIVGPGRKSKLDGSGQIFVQSSLPDLKKVACSPKFNHVRPAIWALGWRQASPSQAQRCTLVDFDASEGSGVRNRLARPKELTLQRRPWLSKKVGDQHCGIAIYFFAACCQVAIARSSFVLRLHGG